MFVYLATTIPGGLLADKILGQKSVMLGVSFGYWP